MIKLFRTLTYDSVIIDSCIMSSFENVELTKNLNHFQSFASTAWMLFNLIVYRLRHLMFSK